MKLQAIAAVPMAAVAPVTSFRKSRLVTSGWPWMCDGGSGRISHHSPRYDRNAGVARDAPNRRTDPRACPEFNPRRPDPAADGAHTRVVPAPLQHAAGTG